MGGVGIAQATIGRGGLLGKIGAPLDQRLTGVEWGEFRIGDLFEIDSTNSFDSDVLTVGTDYDYVTRTSINQGILRQTGFVNAENINSAGNWSLGLLQMDFFYREKPWYAGQFVRKVTPRMTLNKNACLFFSVILNKLKPLLLNVLVRNVNETFLNAKIFLPIRDGDIDYNFIDKFVAELEAYLSATGLKDYDFTAEEENALSEFGKCEWVEYDIPSVFEVRNTNSIMSRDVVENSGTIPYLCASSENNGVSSYISYNENCIDRGNCIFIGGKTFVVSYQERDFFSNDSHNLSLTLLEEEWREKREQIFLATCVRKSLGHKYSWGDSISHSKIMSDTISLPVIDGEINYGVMSAFIRAIEKLVIRDVVDYADKKIAMTQRVCAG